jgi:hypothetical protein
MCQLLEGQVNRSEELATDVRIISPPERRNAESFAEYRFAVSRSEILEKEESRDEEQGFGEECGRCEKGD